MGLYEFVNMREKSISNSNLKNKFLIYNLVSNYFGLDKRNLKLFKHRLFYEPLIAKEYKEIIKDAKDLRFRIDLEKENFEEFDEGWSKFKGCFSFFVSQNSISYEDFRNNKVKIYKQQFKLTKALINYYSFPKNLSPLINDLVNNCHGFNEILNKCLIKNIFEKQEEDCFLKVKNLSEEVTLSRYSWSVEREIIKTKKIKKIIYNKEIIDCIKESIIRKINYIGIFKLPTSKLQLVLSLNFADWFLCSTGESWSSCLNLESECDMSYWSGLPGLIGDKNRALIYITDGTKKDYRGIKVDKILGRTWALLVRNKENNRTELSIVGEYPCCFGIENMCNFIKLPLSNNCNFISLYYLELLYHRITKEKKYLSLIYTDNSFLKIARKNKAKWRLGDYGYFIDSDGLHGNILKYEFKDGSVKLQSDSTEGFYNNDGNLDSLVFSDSILPDYFGRDFDDIDDIAEEEVTCENEENY